MMTPKTMDEMMPGLAVGRQLKETSEVVGAD